MGKHSADYRDIGIDKQLRLTAAVQELCFAAREIPYEKRAQFLAHVYTRLVEEWKTRDGS